MTGYSTPRQMVQELLRGIAPPRPLFLPIVFSPGARVENQALPAFLANPTKICSAQRQMRAPLRTDGFSCYFDPFLEVEALGATLRWAVAGQPPEVCWPHGTEPGELPGDLRTPEEAAKSGRVPVAVEVLRRMKSMVRDDSILMAGVTGPFTLAARLTQMDAGRAWRAQDLLEYALELASSVVTRISGALAEAGASLIMIREEILPVLSEDGCDVWASTLEPAFNVIRFYEALPVLLLSDAAIFAVNSAVILQHRWDCVLCPSLHEIPPQTAGTAPVSHPAMTGLALPLEAFQLDDSALPGRCEGLQQVVAAWRPSILTTEGDIPANTDMKQMTKVLEKLPRSF